MKVIVLKNNIKQFEISVLDDDLVNGGELFIGREDDCHIILDSQQISRHHAKIYFSENKLKLETISSFGGVKINGHDVSLVDLTDLEQIEIDQYQINIQNFQGYLEEEVEEDIDKALDAEMALNEAVPQETYNDTTEILDPAENEEVLDEVEPLDDPIGDELEEELLADEDLTDSNLLDDELSDSSLDDSIDDDGLDEDVLGQDDDLGSLDENISDDEIDDVASDAFGDESSEENFSESDDFSAEDGFSEDEGFDSGDGFGDDAGFEEDDDSKTQVFNSFATYYLKIFGEYAPFDSYKIEDNLTNIGREEETCQILLNDPEVSKIHAVIKKTLVNCTIQDNNSSNGIILNGERVNKAELTNGDEFIIGDTSFTVIINSDLLNSEQGRLMPVEENQEIIIEDDSEGGSGFGEGEDGVDFNEQASVEVVVEKSFIKRILKNPKQRIYLFVVIGVLALVMFDTDPEKKEVSKDKEKVVKTKEPKQQLRQDILDRLEVNYSLALAKYENGQYTSAKEFILKVKADDPTYKLTASLDKSIQESLDAITRAKEEEALKKQRLLKLKRVKDLVEKARKAVSEKNVAASKNYFSAVYELDPENIDIPPLKIEIESYVEMEKRKKQEIALLKAKRSAMVDKLRPGKRLYIKGKWYNAVATLGKFLNDKEMDEDLIKEATTMLTNSKRKLLLMIDPLVSKARSYKEGQDLKLAYETFGDVLKYDPSNEESLNERASIFEVLNKRSKKIFREGLIKEDLSDFSNAKEKFQEVQQISPINSEYYIKATDKLKRYLE
jgi:pSer/pThr/pTyr-binding forkhead associated (FHA) protein